MPPNRLLRSQRLLVQKHKVNLLNHTTAFAEPFLSVGRNLQPHPSFSQREQSSREALQHKLHALLGRIQNIARPVREEKDEGAPVHVEASHQLRLPPRLLRWKQFLGQTNRV